MSFEFRRFSRKNQPTNIKNKTIKTNRKTKNTKNLKCKKDNWQILANAIDHGKRYFVKCIFITVDYIMEL